jgi:hypothetical protein
MSKSNNIVNKLEKIYMESVNKRMDRSQLISQLNTFKQEFKALMEKYPDILVFGDRDSQNVQADLHAVVKSSNGKVGARLTRDNKFDY